MKFRFGFARQIPERFAIDIRELFTERSHVTSCRLRMIIRKPMDLVVSVDASDNRIIGSQPVSPVDFDDLGFAVERFAAVRRNEFSDSCFHV